MADLNNFMNWWHSINTVLRAIEQPELRYGEARNFFNEARAREVKFTDWPHVETDRNAWRDWASGPTREATIENQVSDEWADDLAAAVIEQGRSL